MSGLPGAAEGGADAKGGSPVRHISLWPPPRSTRHSAKRRRNLILGLAAVLVLGSGVGSSAVWVMQRGAASTADGSAVPESYAGTWRGEMSQVNEAGQHVADWGAEVKLERGEERGVAEWYTFDCRGSLDLTERTDGRLAFHYVETYDPEERCVDESDLVLERGGSAGTLEARWTAVSHNGVPMTSTGTLR